MSMTLEELEAEVKRLKEQVAEAARAKDYVEIYKLQSLYSHLYHIGKRSEVPSLFAQKTPGVIMEIEDSGVYEGIEGVKRFWNTVLTDKMHLSAGSLALHMTVNPVIEIKRMVPGQRESGILTDLCPWQVLVATNSSSVLGNMTWSM